MRHWFLFAGCLIGSAVSAQTAVSFFKPVAESAVTLSDGAVRKKIPARYQVYRLDYPGVKAALMQAPMEFTPAAGHSDCVLELPMADGSMEAFSIWETSMMEPALAAEMPFIRTYAGRSLSNPGKTVAINYSLRGFHAMVLRPDRGLEFIERYAAGQNEWYMAYDAKDLPESETYGGPTGFELDPNLLNTDPQQLYTPPANDRGVLQDPVTLKVYKIIISTTGEFGQDNGPTKQDVMSAAVEIMKQVNAIYERDLDIRFDVVQASLAVMFLDPATDPFTGTTVQEWIEQNQDALNGVGIPAAAYDIGHVLARGGGGVGGLGVTCTQGKSRGCTAGSGNYGIGFIGVLCQEIGHQMDGGHTWNRCGGAAADQRFPLAAFEPGSGSTIMSYVGACGSDNIQGSRDMYFHAGSIDEITSFVKYAAGAFCGTNVTTTNFPPEVTLPYQDNFFIPIGTPFELNGTATDPDGDALSYCWEEMDLGPEAPLNAPVASSPLFRTRPAVSASNRYFPRLMTVVSNGFDLTEQLPQWTRDLTFRLTARDNRSGGGGVGSATVAFKSWAEAGPFLVTAPNTASDIWRIGEYTRVSWDVSGTNLAPVNCKRVNIRLSTDGGYTYPITLASDVANDGSYDVLVPDIHSNTARVRIDAADNVFYDISNSNFKIQSPAQPSLTVGFTNDVAQLCLPDKHVVEVLTASVLGYSDPVTLSIDGALPADVTASWSATTVMPGQNATLTLDFSQVNVEDVFHITVRAESATAGTFLRDIVITTIRNDFSALALTLPANGSTELQLKQTLRWTKAPDALTYDVEFASDPSFAPGTILASQNSTTLDSFKVPVFLSKGQPYYWHVRPRNECGAHDWTDPFFFSTYVENCQVRQANDLPKNLTSNGTPTIESKVVVLAGGPVKSVAVGKIQGYHEFFKNMEVRLISPKGTEVVLWEGKCANYNGSFNLAFNDEAPSAMPCPPPKNGLAYRPATPLSTFFGENSTGTWTLRVHDNEIGSGGSVEALELEFCSEATVTPPYLVNNNILYIEPGNNKPVTADLLLVEDPNNTHSQLQYTLLATPKHGHLERAWTGAMQPGAHFTQADIDNGALRFFDYGTDATPDYFTFMVTDGEGGYFGSPKFIIQPFPVGTQEPGVGAFGFQLFPNPAVDQVWLAADLPARTDLPVSVFNTAGQRVLDAELQAGADRLLLSTSAMPRGIYFVQLQGTVRKLVLH